MPNAATASRPARPSARLRPGERPGWWQADADQDQFAAWRAAAADHRIGVDALVAVLIELDLVLDDLRPISHSPQQLLRSLLALDTKVPRLGAPAPWRSWLADGVAPYEFDELPDLVLPERLIARLTPGQSLHPRVRLPELAFALDCDRHSARWSRTLESWALQGSLRVRGQDDAVRCRPAPGVSG